MEVKEYNLYILRAHYQVRAKQKMLGSDWYVEKSRKNLILYENYECPDPVEPEIKKVEKYKITLNVTNPNLRDLYLQIRNVCPEFNSKKMFHLYWKISARRIFPISNLISYLSMISIIANENNNLYLVARGWSEHWLNDMAATYIPLPEDVVLINMVAPHQSVFTAAQENQMNIAKTAARPEYTRTYSPPARIEKKGKDKGKNKEKEKSPSQKSKGNEKEKSPSHKSKGTEKEKSQSPKSKGTTKK